MKDIEEQSTSFEIKLHEVQSDQQLLDAIFNLKSQINFYKSALANAEQLMFNYSSENIALKKQNAQLKDKTQSYQRKLKAASKQISSLEGKREKQRQNQVQMMSKIQQLSSKLAKYEETIDLLDGKIAELNLQINRHGEQKKYNERIYDEFNTTYRMSSSTNETPRNKLKKSQTYSAYENQRFQSQQLTRRSNFVLTPCHKYMESKNKSNIFKKLKSQTETRNSMRMQ